MSGVRRTDSIPVPLLNQSQFPGALDRFQAAADPQLGVDIAKMGACGGQGNSQLRGDLAALMLHLHDTGVVIWQLFFFVHLVILGQLVARSGQYPRLLGHAMSLGSFGYIFDSLDKFIMPESPVLGAVTVALLVVVSLAEIGFALWLIIRGPRQA